MEKSPALTRQIAFIIPKWAAEPVPLAQNPALNNKRGTAKSVPLVPLFTLNLFVFRLPHSIVDCLFDVVDLGFGDAFLDGCLCDFNSDMP